MNAFSMGDGGLASMVNISFTQICTADTTHPMSGSLLWQWRYDTQAPTAPSAVTAAQAVGGAVTWAASPSGDTAHTIARLVPGAATQLSPAAGYPLSDGTATQATIPAVTAGTYTVAVFAVDGAGNVSKPGTKTITIGATTPVVSVPSAPTLLSVVAGDGRATAEFTPPVSDGGAPITGYRLRSIDGPENVSGTGSPLTLTGLTNGVGYRLVVVAVNKAGVSAPSLMMTVTPRAPAVPPVVGKQLLPDPGFESGTGGWQAFVVGTLTSVAAPVHGGHTALKVSATSAAANLVGLTQNTAVGNSSAGTLYTASCWVQPTGPGLNVRAELLEYTQDFRSNIHLPMTTANSLPTGVWTRITWSGTAAKSAERIIPQIYAINQTTATGSLIYDDCSLTTG